MHIYGNYKDSTNEIFCRAAVETHIQRTDLWTQGVGEEGEDEMDGESNMETYITICKIDKSMGICCITQGSQGRAL